MRFRPCIDIHNGQVKQIVGQTLQDEGNRAVENFASSMDAGYFAERYQQHGLKGGHVIMLNSRDSEFYPKTKQQAISALQTYPGGLQIGGGITDENAAIFLDAGASHVIVTSFIFQNGEIRYDHLEQLVHAIGRERIVIDVSCRSKDGTYYVVTDRWQHFTNVQMSKQLLTELAEYCDEFLIHAVDVEGCQAGIDEQVVSILADYSKQAAQNAADCNKQAAQNAADCNKQAAQDATDYSKSTTKNSTSNRTRRITYAGGISAYEDIERLYKLGEGHIDATIGSALDLFGGHLDFGQVVERFRSLNDS